MADAYQQQDRGGASAYDVYLRGMDASMRQKVALTAAHLLCEGKVADLGMGSGRGSHALAALYPELEVVGVDIDPVMVAHARAHYRLPNLRFVEGDIVAQTFEPGSLEGILASSVLHHVTSYNGYRRQLVEPALEAHVAQLAVGGVLVVRDFLDPGPGEVWLDVPHDDFAGEHDDPSEVERCSSEALLERFAREFRALLPEAERGFALRRVRATAACPLAKGFSRYQLAHTHAVEFLLRKDYRDSWAVEVQEEYTVATQGELEAMFARLGLRVLASTPIRNPWIVRHRFEDKARLWTTAGAPLDVPATNYVIVGQRAPRGGGVRIEEAGPRAPVGFLELAAWRRTDSGQLYDLARRPNAVVDVIPWFSRDGNVHILARRSYPRPILGCRRGGPTVDGAAPSTYVTDPLNVPLDDKPIGQTVDELMADFPGIGPDRIRGYEPGTTYYPSPGGIQEEVRSVFVEIEPVNVDARLAPASGFSSSGDLRAVEARQLLRAAQVGALPDARLELNTYDLLMRRGRNPGEWIGEALELSTGPAPASTTLAELAGRPHRRRFRRASEPCGFLALSAADFIERDADGQEVARQTRELVTPVPLSANTVAVAVLRRCGDRVYLGIDDHDLPAAQCFAGNSEILVAPAWRLPHDVAGVAATRAWIAARLRDEHGLGCARIFDLGGRYFPSAGLTPEVVHPLAVDAREEGGGARPLAWVDLADVVANREALRDGHLRAVALRAAHALGLLAAAAPR